jgi:hypothetical protein
MDELIFNTDRLVEYREILSGRILNLLAAFESEATVEDVQDLILYHDGTAHPSECFADMSMLFNAGEDDLDTLLPVIQDAWNYFPHRSLGGRCPAEIMVDLTRLGHARRRKTIKF